LVAEVPMSKPRKASGIIQFHKIRKRVYGASVARPIYPFSAT
jgi:hypothetical protein